MNVKFTVTSKTKLPTVPIENGQIIAIWEESGVYYDMNDTRYTATNVKFVDELPEEGDESVLYIYDSTLKRFKQGEWIDVLQKLQWKVVE